METFLSPLWGSLISGLTPTAYAVGFTLSPLRGWTLDILVLWANSRKQRHARALSCVDIEAENGVHFDGLVATEHGMELPIGQRGQNFTRHFASAGFQHLRIS